MKKCLLALAVVAALGVTACGDTQTETVTEQAAVEAPAVQQPQPTGDKLGPSAAKVPDVAGMDHQLAQDTMQASGFYSLVEEDCTGQGRMLLLDRNWVVRKQTPAAGTIASDDADVTLCSVKEGE